MKLTMGGIFLILSGKEIFRRLGEDIVIEPFESSRLNPNSYNLRLHNELLVYEDDILDMKKRSKGLLYRKKDCC